MSPSVRTLLSAAVLLALAGCSSGAAREATPPSSAPAADEMTGTLTVFAAASLTDVFESLGEQLTAEHPGLTVRFNFAGSSALAAQILEGAPADVLATADEAQMARVEEAGLADDPELFAANPLMLAVPRENPADVTPPADQAGIPRLADLVVGDLVMAVCAPEVPCGAAAAEVLAASGLAGIPDTYEEDVRGVLTKVGLGEVEAGLVYLSDVHAAGDSIHAYAFAESARAVNRYPVGRLADAPNPAAAEAFVDLVLSEAGQRALRDAGFLQP